ncbi:PEGA domain-containing protein [Corallococcus praedator]|uniref:non-specific serine/threonine protein kinase n=1 Tax=Corallococcus praedator TaxID=2316724 RepID=A0ABX9QJZ2_9BACT|nr:MULTISPECIES: serine/threonine-protein kinase [Corallococcus]RKH34652.1 PEGA domain-containing protein [Corallococcus sp. CA031C]RKI10375.1 PEGA domain-containing protein [Corallococcus praedator]
MSSPRYQSLGPLLAGEGSRAFLGLALEDGATPRPVVLIWAPPEIAQNPELVARLEKETNRALVFEHPNILRVHGLEKLDGGLARVTEFADGEPLRRVLEVHPRMSPAFAALVVADAAMGLHYAHVAGNDDGSPLVHGDIRPETLMVSFSGFTKVTGYGALSVAPRERGGKRVKNRRAYTSPEQLLGGREAVNVQSDVFLLGLTLHECLTGKMPFKESADPDKAVLNRALPPMPPDVPLKLDAVVRRATTKRALERYPSALAFREAVVEAIGKLPTHESFAEHLAKLFPPESDARAARRKTIELGIADALAKAGMPAPQIAEVLAQGAGLAEPVKNLVPEVNSAPASTGAASTAASGAQATSTGAVAASSSAASSGAASVHGANAGAQAAASHNAKADTQASASSPPANAQASTASPQAQGANAGAQGSASTPGAHASAQAGAQGAASTQGAHASAQAGAQGTQAQTPAHGAASTPDARPAGPIFGGAASPTTQVSAPAQKSSRAWIPYVVGGLALTLGAGAVVIQRQLQGTMTVETFDAGIPAVVAAPFDAGVEDAGVEDAGIVDAGPVMGMLDLTVEPRVEVTLNSTTTLLGRTPLSVPLPPGRHLLTFTNGALGISVSRTVTVAATGRSAFQFFLNKAFINVRGPAGANVTIDGKPAGTVPVEELDVYEGYHRLLVTVGPSRWQKTFTIEPGQRVNFDVNFEEPQEAEE